jgi:hypothetical protein
VWFEFLACIAGVDEVLSRLDAKGVATSATYRRNPFMVRSGPLESINPSVAHLHPGNMSGDSEGGGRKAMHHLEVLATTLNSAGGKDTENLIFPKKFDVLIVDEATQATEPALLIPLSLLKSSVRSSATPESISAVFFSSTCL